MADHLKATIADLEEQLAKKLAEVAKTKDTINRVSELAGLPLPYPDAEEPEQVGGPMRPDQFYGQPLHTAMRSYLEMRQHRGPASVNEIFSALTEGGYQFDTKNDANAKRVIRITLTKNSGVFHKLPGGSYGLLAWYPNAKKQAGGKKSNGADDSDSEETEAASNGDEAEEEAVQE